MQGGGGGGGGGLYQMARRVIEKPKQAIECSVAPFSHRKRDQINTKLETEKEIVREVALGDIRHLRVTADHKAQISNAVIPLPKLICAL